MAAFFSSLGKTIIAGIVLLVVILLAVGGMFGDAGARPGDHVWWAFVMRWLHVLSGVMWIGLLWYFNFVQTVVGIPGFGMTDQDKADIRAYLELL